MADNPQTEIEIKNDTGAAVPVSAIQSGVWSMARTWNLASGTDSVSAVQSGVWSVSIASGTGAKVVPIGPVSTNSYPNPISAYPDPYTANNVNDYPLTLDVFDNLQTRGPVLTDELSFRDDFSGSSLFTTLTGQLKFSSTTTEIDGVSSTIFTRETYLGYYIKRSAGADSEFVQIDYTQDDSTLFATTVYSGNFNNQTSVISRWKPTVVGGASYNVGSSLLNLVSSTASGNSVSVQNVGDYLPYNLQFSVSVSQRIANQTTTIGFQDSLASPQRQAVVIFDGTTNTTVKFRTAWSSAAADTQETVVTLPAGATTSSQNVYQIDVVGQRCALSINGTVLAIHEAHIPGPYDVLSVMASIANAAVVTTTTVAIDYIYLSNQNRLNISNDFDSDAVPALNFGKNSAGFLKAALMGSLGEQMSADIGTAKATYSASIIGLAPAASATDIFTITGSATKTIRITKLEISGIQTTAGNVNVQVVKRSTANSSGTSTTQTAVPHDSTSAAASATVRAYTANPTTGTLVGALRSYKLFVPTASVAGSVFAIDVGGDKSQPFILRGTGEVLAINLNAATVSGGSFNIDIEWTEE